MCPQLERHLPSPAALAAGGSTPPRAYVADASQVAAAAAELPLKRVAGVSPRPEGPTPEEAGPIGRVGRHKPKLQGWTHRARHRGALARVSLAVRTCLEKVGAASNTRLCFPIHGRFAVPSWQQVWAVPAETPFPMAACQAASAARGIKKTAYTHVPQA